MYNGVDSYFQFFPFQYGMKMGGYIKVLCTYFFYESQNFLFKIDCHFLAKIIFKKKFLHSSNGRFFVE